MFARELMALDDGRVAAPLANLPIIGGEKEIIVTLRVRR
jgi:hypothetical protein